MKVTGFGISLIGVMALAVIVGVANGVWAVAEHAAASAYISGIITAMPIFMIVGRVWLRAEIQETK